MIGLLFPYKLKEPLNDPERELRRMLFYIWNAHLLVLAVKLYVFEDAQ